MDFNFTHAGYELKNFNPIFVGVINLSPESFYKGSVASESQSVSEKTKKLISEGAQIIDVGAISSRPVSIYGGEVVGEKEELSRIDVFLPEILQIAKNQNIPVSMDTQSSIVAERAIDYGCTIINDISGLKNDPNMAEVIAENDVDVVLMSTMKQAGDTCTIEDVISALGDSLDIARDNGINREKCVLDPAFGGWQGKSKDCDLNILSNFDELKQFQLPIYVGVSRKSTIKNLDGGENPEDRLVGSVILTNWLIEKGASIIRTHDIKDTLNGFKLYSNLRKLAKLS